jgi:hypothetical protein
MDRRSFAWDASRSPKLGEPVQERTDYRLVFVKAGQAALGQVRDDLDLPDTQVDPVGLLLSPALKQDKNSARDERLDRLLQELAVPNGVWKGATLFARVQIIV